LQGLFLQTRDISSVVHIQNVGSLKLTNIIAKTTTSLQKDELGIRCQMVMGYKQPNKYLSVHGGIHGNSDTAHHPGTCHTDGLSGNTDILTLTYFNHLWEGGGVGTKILKDQPRAQIGAIHNEQQMQAK